MLEQDYFFKRQGDMSNLKVNTIKGKTTETLVTIPNHIIQAVGTKQGT